MAYKIRFKRSVAKDLNKLNQKEKIRILDKIDEVLKIRPADFPKLKGEYFGLRKLRIGSYRVIFSILDDEVHVLRIGHRTNVYK